MPSWRPMAACVRIECTTCMVLPSHASVDLYQSVKTPAWQSVPSLPPWQCRTACSWEEQHQAQRKQIGGILRCVHGVACLMKCILHRHDMHAHGASLQGLLAAQCTHLIGMIAFRHTGSFTMTYKQRGHIQGTHGVFLSDMNPDPAVDWKVNASW